MFPKGLRVSARKHGAKRKAYCRPIAGRCSQVPASIAAAAAVAADLQQRQVALLPLPACRLTLLDIVLLAHVSNKTATAACDA